MADSKKLTTRELIGSIAKVAHLTYKAAPLAVVIQVIGAIITAVLPIVATYFAALTTTELVNAVTGVAGAEQKVITYVLITAFLGIASTAWSSLEQYITQIMRYRVESSISDQMYEHFLRLEFWKYDDKDTRDIYDKATRFANFFPYVFDRLSSVATQFIAMIAGLVALTIVSWWLGLITIAAVIPGIIIQFRLSRAQTKHWNENVDTRRSKGMIEWDLLQPQHIGELRLYGVVRYLLDMRAKLREKDEKQQIEFERKYIFKRLGANVIEAAAELFALLWTVVHIVNHTLPIGQFIYVQQIVSRALSGASGFIRGISSIDEDIANLVDYQVFMDMSEQSQSDRQLLRIPQTIQFENVSFRYPEQKSLVLDGVTFSIKQGEHVAIVGENGAGKTTLIKLLTGLYEPVEGSVLLDGTPLNEFDVASWHKHIAVLQQQYLSYGFATAKDNVYFGDVSKPFDSKRFEAALDKAESRKFLEKLPKGVDNYVLTWMKDDEGNKGVDLSGGQWQRLALARNFYRNSKIIILDEPTSAVDALAEDRIFQHLQKDNDKTIITISHRLSTVKKADSIMMFENGKLVEQGAYETLVKNKGAFYKMFKSQL